MEDIPVFKTTIAYQADLNTGFYIGETIADEDQMAPGEYLLPAGASFKHPPEIFPGYVARLVDGDWQLEPAPKPPAVIAPLPLPEDTPFVAEIRMRVQQLMDSVAQSWGYDSIASAITYADEPSVPKFQHEGQALREWRSLVWQYCYDELEAFENGDQQFTNIADFMASLPTITRPTS